MTFRILYSQQLIMCAFKKKLTRKWCVLLSFASNKVQNVPCLGNVFIPAFSYQWKLLISNHQYLFLLLLILYKIFYLGYISLFTYFQIVHLDIQNKKINKLHFFITIAWKSLGPLSVNRPFQVTFIIFKFGKWDCVITEFREYFFRQER